MNKKEAVLQDPQLLHDTYTWVIQKVELDTLTEETEETYALRIQICPYKKGISPINL